MELKNLHQVLNDAAIETEKESKAMVPVTLKIYEEEKELAKQICEAHGTNISAFLRNCMRQLISGYHVK